MHSSQIAYAKNLVESFAKGYGDCQEIQDLLQNLRSAGVEESVLQDIETAKMLPLLATKI